MEQFRQSNNFSNSEEYGWIIQNSKAWLKQDDKEQTRFKKCIITDVDGENDKVTIKSDDKKGQQQIIKPSQILKRSDEDNLNYNDMTDMECLNEAELLYNLKNRYQNKLIYTYVGPTLIAMNPFVKIDGMYTDEAIINYQSLVHGSEHEHEETTNLQESPVRNRNQTIQNNPISSLNPHVFATSAESYNDLFQNEKKQAIVISGESGAGKTENTKFCMKFLTSLNKQHENSDSELENDEESKEIEQKKAQKGKIEDRILNCNPILEAFGNAKTVRNDNSSRFGKYVQIIINMESRKIKGAQISNYLLEKSRIVMQGQKERNFHIFYQLLKGADTDMIQKYNLSGFEKNQMQKLNYLNKSKCFSTSNIDDEKDFQELLDSMEVLGFKNYGDTMWRLTSSVLLLGNLDIDESTYSNDTPCSFKDQSFWDKICELLDVDSKELQLRILSKSRVIGGKEIISPFNKSQCQISRDSFAKYIYYHLFDWIVTKLNDTIQPGKGDNIDSDDQFVSSVCSEDEDDYQSLRNSIDQVQDFSNKSIGILDIYGFEVFAENGFEQFFINYTNEKLQQLYIFYVFKQEKTIFINEGLEDKLNHLNFTDNQLIIDLLDKPPFGIFNLLDETCTVNGNDDGFLSKIRNQHKAHQNFEIPKMTSKKTFLISHSAKKVEYTVINFVEKNKDDMQQNILETLTQSNNPQIKGIFKNIYDQILEQQSKKAKKTTGSKFRAEMKRLMDELLESDCHFIRCIKSNEEKKALGFTEQLVSAQIECLGILESIKVRLESYPVRQQYKFFYKKYSYIAFPLEPYHELVKKNADFKVLVENLINKHMGGIGEDLLLYGKTRLFLRNKALQLIDKIFQQKISVIENAVIILQRKFRSNQLKKKFANVVWPFIFFFRMRQIVRNYREKLRREAASIKIQRWIRKTRGQERRMRFRQNTMIIQNFCQTKLISRQNSDFKKKVCIIQRCLRRFKVKLDLKKELFLEKLMNISLQMAWDKIRFNKTIIIQKYARGFIVRRKFKEEIYQFRIKAQAQKREDAALIIQKNYKAIYYRKLFLRKKKAIQIIQAYYKMVQLRNSYIRLKTNALIIQRNIRSFALKKLIKKHRLNDFEYKENVEECDFNEECGLFGDGAVLQMQQQQLQQQKIEQINKTITQQNNCVSQNNLNSQQSLTSISNNQNQNSSQYKNKNKQLLIQTKNELSTNGQQSKQQKSAIQKQYNPQFITDKKNKSKLELMKELQNKKKTQGLLSPRKNNINQNLTQRSQNQLQQQFLSVRTNQNADIFQNLQLENMQIKQQQQAWKQEMFDQSYSSSLIDGKIYLFNQIIDMQALTDTKFIYQNQNQISQQDQQNPATWSGIYSDIFSLGYPQSNFVQSVQIGETHTLLATSNSTLYTFGWNDYLQCGVNLDDSSNTENKSKQHYYELKFQNKVQQISTDQNNNLVLDESGNVYQWGNNQQIHQVKGIIPEPYQISEYDELTILQNSQQELFQNKKMKSVKSNSLQNYAIDFEGQLYTWPILPQQKEELLENGQDEVDFYKFNLQNLVPQFTQKILVQNVACGLKFTMILTQSGHLFGYGRNDQGQLGLGDKKSRDTPQFLESLQNSKVQEIDCGMKHCIARCSSNKVYTWGWGHKGQLGHGNLENQLQPTLINMSNLDQNNQKLVKIQNQNNQEAHLANQLKVIQIKAGRTSSLFLQNVGNIYWFGTNSFLKEQKIPIKFLEAQRCPIMDKPCFYPVRIQTSYSNSISLTSITYAYTDKDPQIKKNPLFKKKIMNNLTQKWVQNSIDSINPSYDQNLSHYLSMTNMNLNEHHNIKQQIKKQQNKPLNSKRDLGNNVLTQQQSQIIQAIQTGNLLKTLKIYGQTIPFSIQYQQIQQINNQNINNKTQQQTMRQNATELQDFVQLLHEQDQDNSQFTVSHNNLQTSQISGISNINSHKNNEFQINNYNSPKQINNINQYSTIQTDYIQQQQQQQYQQQQYFQKQKQQQNNNNNYDNIQQNQQIQTFQQNQISQDSNSKNNNNTPKKGNSSPIKPINNFQKAIQIQTNQFKDQEPIQFENNNQQTQNQNQNIEKQDISNQKISKSPQNPYADIYNQNIQQSPSFNSIQQQIQEQQLLLNNKQQFQNNNHNNEENLNQQKEQQNENRQQSQRNNNQISHRTLQQSNQQSHRTLQQSSNLQSHRTQQQSHQQTNRTQQQSHQQTNRTQQQSIRDNSQSERQNQQSNRSQNTNNQNNNENMVQKFSQFSNNNNHIINSQGSSNTQSNRQENNNIQYDLQSNASFQSQISFQQDNFTINLLDSDQAKLKNVQKLQKKIKQLQKIPYDQLKEKEKKLVSLANDKYFLALTETIKKEKVKDSQIMEQKFQQQQEQQQLQ